MSQIFEDMGIDVGFIIILLMIVAVVLIVMMMLTMGELKRVKRQYKSFMTGMDGASLEKKFRSRFSMIDKLSLIQDKQEAEMKLLHVVQDRSLTKYGIYKYDAFEDVGGKMSFALAMLDRKNTGFVLNVLHSKDNCFLYVKEIVTGESYIALSKEEIKALQEAEAFGAEEDVIANYERDQA